ncbi:PucR family transcriptional regulator [Nocardia sienata]|uniref:PucR family transcriptional regulator n=1 Tax=Nocardia sienata TaxID=248552 RepID=UPI0007A3719E|nr:helix-turn-helix domain-containing protein [Nocardia sienata]
MSAGSQTVDSPLPERVRLERIRIAGSIYERADEIADLSLSAILAQLPGYTGRDAEFHADVHEQVARLCRTGLGALLDTRRVTAADLAGTRRAAVRRARSGLPLIDYITAFRLGQQAFWKSLVAHAGNSPDAREATLSMVLPLTRYCDLVSTQATHAYLEYQQHRSADAGRDSRELLDCLLGGTLPDRGPLPATAAAHGIGMAARDRLLVVTAAVRGIRENRPATTAAEAAHHVSSALARTAVNGHRTLAAVRDAGTRDPEIVAVASLGRTGTAEELCARLKRTCETLADDGVTTAIGVSTVSAGVEYLPRARQEARAALDLLPDEGGVMALPELSPFRYLVLRADETAHHLIDPRITRTLSDDQAKGAVLADTIRAFADADMNLREAAETLRIHHNTAKYRLRRIQHLTGRNIRSVTDLVDLLVALELRATPRPVARGR